MSGVDLMIHTIEEMKSSITDSLTTGSPNSLEEYRRMVGVIQGLNFSIEVIREVEKRLMEGDDE